MHRQLWAAAAVGQLPMALLLTVVGPLPDQIQHPLRQRGDQHQHGQALGRARTAALQAQTPTRILGVAKRWLDLHALRVPRRNRCSAELAQRA